MVHNLLVPFVFAISCPIGMFGLLYLCWWVEERALVPGESRAAQTTEAETSVAETAVVAATRTVAAASPPAAREPAFTSSSQGGESGRVVLTGPIGGPAEHGG